MFLVLFDKRRIKSKYNLQRAIFYNMGETCSFEKSSKIENSFSTLDSNYKKWKEPYLSINCRDYGMLYWIWVSHFSLFSISLFLSTLFNVSMSAAIIDG